jgi:hypothetical protein
VISQVLSESFRSSAPASRAISSSFSSSGPRSFSTWIEPLRANIHAVLPFSPRFPPLRVNACRMSWVVRLRLSVSVSTNTATPPGP